MMIYCSDVSDSVTQCLASTLTSWGLNLSSPHLPALSASAVPTPPQLQPHPHPHLSPLTCQRVLSLPFYVQFVDLYEIIVSPQKKYRNKSVLINIFI